MVIDSLSSKQAIVKSNKMSSTHNNNDDNADLNKVIAAVGQQIFSYLPLGSLICGHRSPFLINTIFHDSIFQQLGQVPSLSLSGCSHLRKINDVQLISLIQKIVGISCEEQNTSASTNCLLKIVHLDLSRCRNLRGDAIHYAMKHLPNLKRILLSSSARFDPTATFAGDNIEPLLMNKLEYIDMAGCSKVESTSLKNFYSILNLPGKSSKLLHLDLGGASAMLDDELFGSLALSCTTLESLSLAGAKKISTFGVGLISWICRDTLKALNISGCEGVDLPKLLMATSFEIMSLISTNIHTNHRSILPPNYMRGDTATLSTQPYFAALCASMSSMMSSHSLVEDVINISNRYITGFKRLEQQWEQNYWGTRERREPRIFGKLEQLDISLVGKKRTPLQGCVATIAWLTGGRLAHVKLDGLDSVLLSDLAVLAMTSRDNLKSLTTSSSISDNPRPHTPTDGLSLTSLLYTMSNITELNLSHTNFWSDSGNDQHGILIATLKSLRSLSLDYSNIQGLIVRAVLAKSDGRLLKLTVRGCKYVSSNHLTLGRNRPLTRLLELDARDVEMKLPLQDLRKACPHLLKLNNRCTPRGSQMLKAHRASFLWRVGHITTARKRSRSGERVASSNPSIPCTATNCCTIFNTGLSQAKDTEQELFACRTCNIQCGHFVCLTCVKSCHKGHQTYSVGFGSGYCDCSIFSSCKSIAEGFDEIEEEEDSFQGINEIDEFLNRAFDPTLIMNAGG